MGSEASYLLCLCKTTQESQFSLGVATRIATQTSTFTVDAAKLIHSIVSFSPARNSLAIQFFNALQAIPGIEPLLQPVLHRRFDIPPETWSQNILAFLRDFPGETLREFLQPVQTLTSYYLTHLVVALRNPGGKKTPEESTRPTPDLIRIAEIAGLTDKTKTKRSQTSLKELIRRRDGDTCAFTKYSFDPHPDGHITPQCTHILPFSLSQKFLTLQAIEMFTGRTISPQFIIAHINTPSNAINMQGDCHDRFDDFGWGIEAVQTGDQTKYYYRYLRNRVPFLRLGEGDEIVFGAGESGDRIDRPNPDFCNLKLAIARVFHASGAADIINELYRDEDDEEQVITTQPVYLGGPYVADEVLYKRLDDRLSGFDSPARR